MANSKIFNGVTIYGNLDVGGNYTLPSVDGSNGQVLQTDGGGTVTWQAVSGGTGGGSGSTYSSTNDYISGVTGTITHNLNSIDVIVQLIDTDNNEQIEGYINNFQLNSVDVTLNDTLTNVTTVVAGGIFVSVSGATGSTSPGGSDQDIQYNSSGSFAGDSNFTWDNAMSNFSVDSTTGYNSIITNIGEGDATNVGGNTFRGASMVYNNTLSGASATTSIMIGDLDGFLGDNTVFMGYASTGKTHAIFTTPFIAQMVATDSTTNDNSVINATVDRGITLSSDYLGRQAQLTVYNDVNAFVHTGGTFNVNSSSGNPFKVNNDGTVEFNNAFTFPNSGGTNGQVLQTDGGGNVTWANVSGGGSSIMVVGGGGDSTMRCGVSNASNGNYAAALGGCDNTASGNYSVIGGGPSNTASGNTSTIAGGANNCTYAPYSTIGGGWENTASGNYSVIAGGGGMGQGNTASAYHSTIGGGGYNVANKCFTTVGGGAANTASGYYSTVAGGSNNISSGLYSSVIGGWENTASGYYSTVAGGFYNRASGNTSAIIGGCGNTVSGNYSAIIAGESFSLSANSTVMVPNLIVNDELTFNNITTTSGATLGAGGGLPAINEGFISVAIGGTTYKIPYYNN